MDGWSAGDDDLPQKLPMMKGLMMKRASLMLVVVEVVVEMEMGRR